MGGGDWVSVVEAAYRLEGDEKSWLSGLLAAAAPLMPRNLGVYGFTYDASEPGAFHLQTVVPPAFPPKTGADEVMSMFSGLSAVEVVQSFGSVVCATASQVFGPHYKDKVRMTHFEPHGLHDSFGLNALDPTGHGCGLGGLTPQMTSVDASDVRSWTRVAAHIAAARRLRRFVGPLGSNPAEKKHVEGVVTPSGKLEYAANRHVENARSKLAAAVSAMERARKRTRRSTQQKSALDEWCAMVFARWSLVEHFERDGKRYLVAVHNEASPPMFGKSDALTSRERQVVGFALLGRSSKVTAYELGVSPNTVRVLLARGMRKLGVHSSRELMALATARHQSS